MSALTWAAVLHFASMPACTVVGMVPEFWPAVVQRESGYDPLALHDDTTSRGYYPDTVDSAEAVAVRLMGEGHSVGVGLSQLTARSEQQFRVKFGLTIREALDPCPNMRAGARHYVNGALSVYNAGNATSGVAYARSIVTRVDAPVDGTPQPLAADPAGPAPPSWDLEAVADWRRRHVPTAEEAAEAPAEPIARPVK